MIINYTYNNTWLTFIIIMSHIHKKYTLNNNEDNDMANSESGAIYTDKNDNHIDNDKIVFQNKTTQDEWNKDKQSKNNHSDNKLSNK